MFIVPAAIKNLSCSWVKHATYVFSSQVRDRKGYLKWGKDSLLKECTQRSQELFCETPIIQVTAE